jgi:hypothetical protein
MVARNSTATLRIFMVCSCEVKFSRLAMERTRKEREIFPINLKFL